MKKLIAFLIFLTLIKSGVNAQAIDSLIEKKSAPVKVSFKPKNELSEITITFIKFKDQKYGMEILLGRSINSSTGSFNLAIDDLSFNLMNNKEVSLKNYSTSGDFDPSTNTMYLKTIRLIETAQFDMLKEKMIEKMIIRFKNEKKAFTFKEKSQEELFSIVKSFN